MIRNIHIEADHSSEARKLLGLLILLGRHRSLRDPIAATCEELQLTPPQIHALMWLGHEVPLTMGELARRVGITEKTMTGVVDRLEKAACLQRERDPRDRRIVRTRLTRKGEATFRRIAGQVMQQTSRFLAILDAGIAASC